MSDVMDADAAPVGDRNAADGYVLPDPLPPEPGESLPSLVLRNSAPYRFRDPMRLLKRLRPRETTLAALTYVDSASEFGQRLACFLGITQARLSCITCGTDDPPVLTLLGQRIHHDFVSLENRRYCPVCMADNPYHRAIWDLSVLTACPVHGVRLVRTCPNGHQVNWRTDRVHQCTRINCRAELARAPREFVPDDELLGIRGLATWFDATGPVGFAPMSVGDAVRACFHLGAIQRGIHHHASPINTAESHPDETGRILSTGWQGLSDWPRGFYSLLSLLRDSADERKGRYGLRTQFGYLPEFLGKVADEPFGQLLATEFNRYVAEQPDLATRAHDVRALRSTGDLKHRHLTAVEAATLLGVSFDTLTTLAEQHDLYLVARTGKGAASLLRTDRVNALAELRAALLTKEDVRALFGCDKKTVDKLRKAGFLPYAPNPGDPDGIKYPGHDVYAFLEDLESRVAKGAKKPRHAVTMATIARQMPLPGFDVCDIIEAIRANKLIPAALDRGARGLHRLLFRKDELNRPSSAGREPGSVGSPAGIGTNTGRCSPGPIQARGSRAHRPDAPGQRQI